jgi:glyoxylase-like metal-dependent hydrolase (beta-lactamase superfamily II)
MVPGTGTTLIAPPEGDMTTYLTSLERLAALKPRRLLPSHGPLLEDGAHAIRRLIRHRSWRESRILAAVGPEPRALHQIVSVAYADVTPWLLGLAAHSTLAHLLKLEREGRIKRAGGERWLVPLS